MACQLKLIGNSLHATHVGIDGSSCKDAGLSIPVCSCKTMGASLAAFEVSFFASVLTISLDCIRNSFAMRQLTLLLNKP